MHKAYQLISNLCIDQINIFTTTFYKSRKWLLNSSPPSKNIKKILMSRNAMY